MKPMPYAYYLQNPNKTCIQMKTYVNQKTSYIYIDLHCWLISTPSHKPMPPLSPVLAKFHNQPLQDARQKKQQVGNAGLEVPGSNYFLRFLKTITTNTGNLPASSGKSRLLVCVFFFELQCPIILAGASCLFFPTTPTQPCTQWYNSSSPSEHHQLPLAKVVLSYLLFNSSTSTCEKIT